jgi:hypothetical protein
MSSSLVRTFAFASIAILGTITAGCHTTYVTSAPAHPAQPHFESPPEPVHVHRYTYVHYPSCNVYFEHERNLWFWFDGREWCMGAVLPSHFHIDHHEAVTFEFENEHPYEAPPHLHPEPAFEHGPPSHAPAYGHDRKFTYVHYPSCNVYFDRERRLWFWSEGRDWRMGAELPPRFRVNEHEAVKVELENEKPYEHGNAFRAAHENNGKSQGKFSNDVHDKDVRHVAIDVPKNGGKSTSHEKHDAPDMGPSDSASDHDSHGKSSNDSGSDNHGAGGGDTHGTSNGDTHGNDNHGSSADDGHGNGNAKNSSSGDDKSNKPSDAQGQGSSGNKSDAHGKPDNNGSSNGASNGSNNGQNNGPSDSPSNGPGQGKGKGNDKNKDKDKGKPSKD